MNDKAIKWQPYVYRLVMLSTAAFLLLTLVAMLFYPGGTVDNPDAAGYVFTQNFFSDLGLTTAHNGEANIVARVMFTTALTLAGLGLILFFLAAPALFTDTPSGKAISLLGSLAGIVAGAGYIGVAWTPADLYLEAHINFVFTAFEAFPVAALLYTIAIYRQSGFPKRYAVVYLLFTLLLGAYLWLLFYGPDTGTHQGLVIQVVGQKAIAYSAVLAMFVEGYGALRMSQSQ